MDRRRFSKTLVASAAGAVAGSSWSQAPSPVERREYSKLEVPQLTSSPGKVEVLEFFSYACPHCNAFEPELEAWAGKLPPFVALRRVPVPFLANVETFQRTYYALEALGLVESMQSKVFQAVHSERLRLERVEDVAAVVGRHGGDAGKFLAACKSFSVATSCGRAKKLTADFGVASYPGVPSLAIQGRFVSSPAQVGSGRRALAVTDFLIQKVRA
jgi:protein dithiol oxidoreductase (disulfide-forming)